MLFYHTPSQQPWRPGWTGQQDGEWTRLESSPGTLRNCTLWPEFFWGREGVISREQGLLGVLPQAEFSVVGQQEGHAWGRVT